MEDKYVPTIEGNLRKHMVLVPKVIEEASGIRIFGKLIKSLVFTTDIAIIRNCNADAVLAVYPFTPQPIISQALINASGLPVFCGVGGGTTTGKRVTNLAEDAEFLGAHGVVVNAPTPNETLEYLRRKIEIPIIVTVVSERTDIRKRVESGASIINVSGAAKTPEIVASIRKEFPELPIIATGGGNDESIRRTIEAGANAVTFTPPTNGQIFAEMMVRYRQQENVI